MKTELDTKITIVEFIKDSATLKITDEEYNKLIKSLYPKYKKPKFIR